MSEYGFDLTPILWLLFLAGLSIWGAWELIDYFFIDEIIESPHLLIPEIKLIIKDNQIDTVYIYRKP